MSRTDVSDDSSSLLSLDGGLEVVSPRDVPLGGLRAMTVRRTLPNRNRTTIGPWCFLDHYGPDDVALTGGMSVPPHPHTGLQTVSWLFEGIIHHRDSTGADAEVVPGELNLMTAGSGIQHSEVSSQESGVLHGVQLWVALPDASRHQAPHFYAGSAPTATIDGASVALITGSLPQVGVSEAPHYSPIVAAQIDLPAHTTLNLAVEEIFEHGVLVDEGDVEIDYTVVGRHHLAYLPPGVTQLAVSSAANPARLVLIGGEPFGEELVMWWNFVGRSHDEIVEFRQQWQEGIGAGSEQFGHLDHMPALPAPDMPSVRLKPRPGGALRPRP